MYCLLFCHVSSLQVLVDFVGAIDEDWLYQSSSAVSFSSYLDDITVYFQTMPQTTSAVALWVVKLDALIAPHLAQADSGRGLGKGSIQTSMYLADSQYYLLPPFR